MFAHLLDISSGNGGGEGKGKGKGGVFGGREIPFVVKVILTCAVWYTGSMMNSIFGKSALRKLPQPNTVNIFQLVAVNLILPLFMKDKLPRLRRKDWTSWIIPLAALKIVVSFSSQLSILKVPVSYAHTVGLSRLILHQRHSLGAYLSLIPIMLGVIIASVTEIEFDLIGLISALVSTFTFALQNIYSKKVLRTGLNHIALLVLVSRVSLAALLPYWLFTDGVDIINGTAWENSKEPFDGMTVFFELVLCGISNSMQTIFAFTFLSMVTPVSYSVANVAKRVVIIVVSMFIFKNPVTMMNVFGMMLAICGIAMYNRAKLADQALAARRRNDLNAAEPILPIVKRATPATPLPYRPPMQV